MESKQSWEQNLIELLAEVEEQAKKMEGYLDEPLPSLHGKPLVQKIRSAIGTAITMVTEGIRMPNTGSDSPQSASDSPRSEGSTRPFTDERREMSKKRKTMPKWSRKVQVHSGSGMETPMDDGFSWRKYGQKDILGAHYPRSYYRCTHRPRGCPATKQVQRSDEDPSVFDVMYRGDHTCRPMPQPIEDQQQEQQQQQPPLDPQLLQSFQTSLQIKTQGLEPEAEDPASSFSFSSTPASCLNLSPDFVPTTTADSFLTQCMFGGKSELADIVAAATQVESSNILDMNFGLDHLELDTSFAFDATNFKWW